MNRVMSRDAAVVFAVAVVMRTIVLLQLSDLAIVRTPQLDALEYLAWARALVADPWYWPQYPEHAPGYPMFLALLLAVSGGSTLFACGVQLTLASLSCVLTARIAGRMLTSRAYLPAGLLQATYAPLLYLDTTLIAEPLLLFCLLLAVDTATRSDSRASRWFVSGVLLGLAAIVRPTALALMPVLLLARRGDRDPRAVRFGQCALVVAGVLLLVVPVAYRNWSASGTVMIQGYGGMNFYLGNTPSSDGGARARLGGTWDELEADASRAGVARAGQDGYFIARALQEIAAAPAGYVVLLASKLVWLTQDEELRDTHSFYFFREHAGLLRLLPGFGLILALAAVSAMARRRLHAPRILLWCLVLLSATVLLLVVGLRYRAPLVPFVIMFAGAGTATLVSAARGSRWREVAIGIATVVAVLALANGRTDDRSRNVAEEWAFTGLSLQQEGRSREAEEAYRRAIAHDENSAFAWDGLGVVLQSQGKQTAAREAFERAIAANDRYALGWYHVASARDAAGDVVGALLAYERALAIAPERTDIVLAYGLTLHREGRLEDADPFLMKAAERHEGRAHFALALSAMQRRDVATARRHAAEAARLLPDYAPARQLLSATDGR
jgi:Tfp pilus assembly protein PilF